MYDQQPLDEFNEMEFTSNSGGEGGSGTQTAELYQTIEESTLYTGTTQGNVWNWTLPDNLGGDVKAKSISGT